MRGLALVALLVGCRPDADYVQDLAVADFPVQVCAPGCDTCTDTQVCYGGALPSQAPFLSATCLTRCRTTDDCETGFHCVQEPSVYGAEGPVCMSDGLPVRCPGSTLTSCSAATECADANTLSIKFFPASQAVCGRELVHCPNGCSDASDGGAGAGCR